MKDLPEVTYRAKWKELLIGKIGSDEFAIDLTMGGMHVYFPDEETWNRHAPLGLRGSQYWVAARDAALAWCEAAGIPMTVTTTEQSWIEFRA